MHIAPYEYINTIGKLGHVGFACVDKTECLVDIVRSPIMIVSKDEDLKPQDLKSLRLANRTLFHNPIFIEVPLR